MKKIICFLIVAVLLFSLGPAYAAGEITIYVNGNQLRSDVAPIIVEGRTFVPLRVIFEELGAWVDWNGDTKTVTAGKDEVTISLQIGSNTLVKNGAGITLDVPAQIVNGRTLVPVRAVAESFGADVAWDKNTSAVYILTSPEGMDTGDNSDSTNGDLDSDIGDDPTPGRE